MSAVSKLTKKPVTLETPQTIEELSHIISSNRKSGDYSSDSDIETEDLSKTPKKLKKVVRPITPPREPQPQPQVKIVQSKSLNAKPTAQKKTQDSAPLEDSHLEVIKKINEYCLRLPKLFEKDELKAWNNGENNYREDAARALLRTLKTRIISRRKTMIANVMYDKMCDFSEKGMVDFLAMEDMVGFSAYAKESRVLFEDDISEIVCEMGDSWVPGPKIRLMMGVVSLVDEFQKRKRECTHTKK